MITRLNYTMQNVFQLAEIEKKCFGKDAWTINNLRGEFQHQFSHFFAETENGEIIGYVCIRIMYEEAQVCNIAVLESHRRKGVATRLIEEMAGFAKLQGCTRCELEVNTANVPAVELYKKCGFKVEGTRVNFYRKTRYPTRDAYTMVLRLQEESKNAD